MFTVKRSSPVSTSSKPAEAKRIGSTSRERLQKQHEQKLVDERGQPFVSTSNIPVPAMPNTDVGSIPINVDVSPMLTGFTPTTEHGQFHGMYRDIYYNDPMAGSAADLMSILPFGDFSLGGTSDAKILAPYEETVERLNCRTYMSEMSLDFLVMGQHCSSMLYNDETRIFTDFMPHAPENLEIKPLPFYSQDPIITATFKQETIALLQSDHPRIKRLRQRLGADLFKKIAEEKLELDPLTTIYMPRKSTTDSILGTSYFRRLVPYYLIEKNLYRGTLVESGRRQRGILHLTLGEQDVWDPTPEDLEFFTDLFMNADADPVGAIVATKSGVMADEFRQGGDFWKVTDFSESIMQHKLRALCISEGFLSGDASYATADNALSVFIKMLRSYRDLVTRMFFYNKLFPLVSMLNGFTTKNGKARRGAPIDRNDPEAALFQMNDGSKLFIPTVHWAQQLKPEGDSQYIEMLNSMTEKGVPVPLRVLAAAGGMNLDDLLQGQEDDIAVRKKIAKYNEDIAKLAPQQMESESSALMASMAVNKNPIRSTTIAKRGRVSLMSRNFGEESEVIAHTRTGKRKYVHNQRGANERINKMIAKAASEQTKFQRVRT